MYTNIGITTGLGGATAVATLSGAGTEMVGMGLALTAVSGFLLFRSIYTMSRRSGDK